MNSLEIAATPQEAPAQKDSSWRDWLGIVASVGCAIHCAAMPFVIAYLPALGLSFLADEGFHKWMALICFLIAIIAFVPGLIKHRSWIPVSIGSVGLALITVAAFGLSGECCSSCSQASTIASPVSTESSAGTESSTGTDSSTDTESSAASESDCCDEDCEHCEKNESDVAGTVAADSSTPSQSNFLSWFAPWITPIGGILLVAAHLLNRRYGYACSCCNSTTSVKPTPQPV